MVIISNVLGFAEGEPRRDQEVRPFLLRNFLEDIQNWVREGLVSRLPLSLN
jgi:hypothetical protein